MKTIMIAKLFIFYFSGVLYEWESFYCHEVYDLGKDELVYNFAGEKEKTGHVNLRQ